MSYTVTETKEIALTIYNQLGGNKFRAMTGAKGFTSGTTETKNEPYLAFNIGRNSKSISGITIILNHNDLYTMRFWRIRKGRVKYPFPDMNMIHCEDLAKTFKTVTGMETQLPTFTNIKFK
jgi:hypothetical protein